MPQIDEKRLQQLADVLYNRTSGFNDYVLSVIGRRIKATGRLSAADQIALKNMADISGDMQSITKALTAVTELNVRDIESIYTQTVTEGVNSYKPLFDFKGMRFIPFEENDYAKFLVSHWAEETSEKMINLSKTKALCFDKVNALGEVIGTASIEGAFQQAIDEAVVAVSSGVTDFGSAMKKTVENLGSSGVRVNYGNNVTRGLAGMVRQNLLYGAKQAAQEYDSYIGKVLGCDGFEVDYHSGPRPSHAFMGGEQFSYSGDVVVAGNKYKDGSEALDRLNDYGCLHFKMDIILGVSEPRYDAKELARQKAEDNELIEYNGKSKTKYEWKQGARRLEAEARRQRDVAYMAKESGIKSLERQANDKIVAYRKAYDDLCDTVGLEKRYNRMATFPAKNIDKFAKSGIMEKRVFNTKKDPMREIMGPAETSHPKEIEKLMDKLSKMGVRIKRPYEEELSYEPGTMPGEPGIAIISKNASYSAWLHEVKHAEDDYNDGWLGFRVFQDNKKSAQREIDAYQIEIDIASAMDREDIVKRLEELRDAEIKKYEI